MVRSKHEQGFTLIEVLVVVAIIALLISILLPSLAVARDAAKDVKCKAQTKDIGMSLRYCFDENGAYPLHDDGPVSNLYGHKNVAATWIDVLYAKKYMLNLEIATCPKDQQPDPMNSSRGSQPGWDDFRSDGEYGMDYSYGISLPMETMGWKSDADFRIDRNQSSLVLAAESWWPWMHGLGAPGLDVNVATYKHWGGTTVGYRHGSNQTLSANLLFMDGHVDGAKYNRFDKYPNDNKLTRGLRTGDKYFWRSGEHTMIGLDSGWNDKNINGDPYTASNNHNYPHVNLSSDAAKEKYGYPKDLDPIWWTATLDSSGATRWPQNLKAQKGWER